MDGRLEGSVLTFMTWRQALTRYALYLSASGMSPGSIRLRLHHAGRFSRLAPLPRLITPEMLLEMLSAPNLAPESRNSLRASIRKFFGWAADEGLLETNPAARLPKIRVPQSYPRPAPDPIVAGAVLVADLRTRVMLMLAAYAGLRCCEIAKLHHRDVVEDSLRIVGKGGRIRLVPLHPVIRAALPLGSGYMFPGNVDGHLSPLWVCTLVSRALPPGWTAHTLRHRFATAAYAAERDLLAVQQLLGHSSTETTRRYTAIPNTALARAVMAAGPVGSGLGCAS